MVAENDGRIGAVLVDVGDRGTVVGEKAGVFARGGASGGRGVAGEAVELGRPRLGVDGGGGSIKVRRVSEGSLVRFRLSRRRSFAAWRTLPPHHSRSR